MITKAQYFGGKKFHIQHEANADMMLAAVNVLLHEAAEAGIYDYWIDPDTNSQISGSKGGSGDGGYRTSDSKTGAKSSKHKQAQAVDIYDPDRKLAQWCILNQNILDKHGIWIEDPRYTPVWLHCQNVPPNSGKRVFIPSLNPPSAPALEGQKPIPFNIKT